MHCRDEDRERERDGDNQRNRSAEEEPERQNREGSVAGGDAETVTDWMDCRDLTPGEKLRTNIPTLTQRTRCLCARQVDSNCSCSNI